MATSDFELISPPADPRARELWIQHAAGFILMEDVRRGALQDLAPTLNANQLAVAQQAVDATLYRLMQVIDGVTGCLKNESESVRLRMVVSYEKVWSSGEDSKLYSLDLFDGDGICMSIHAWIEGDFGEYPVARPITART